MNWPTSGKLTCAAFICLGVVAVGVGGREEMEDALWTLNPSQIKGKLERHGDPVAKASRGLPRFLVEDSKSEGEFKKNDMSWAEGIYLPLRDPSLVPSDKCRNDVDAIIKVLESPVLQGVLTLQNRYWFAYLVDSWGKTGDGILDGNFFLWGMPSECPMIYVQEDLGRPWNINATFSGRYCLVYTDTSLVTETTPADSPTVRVGASMLNTAIPAFLQFGTCIPSSCTSEDMMVSLEATMSSAGKKPRHVDCFEEKELDGGDIAYIVVLAILGALMVGGALVDWLIGERQNLREGPLRFLLVFSVSGNLKRIFQINNKQDPSVISCLHGMRVLSMTWVVWGHSYAFKTTVSKNALGMYRLTNKVIDQTLVNASYSVDTFFFMSGLLVLYGVMREQQRSGRVNWFLFYFHRFIRLSPAIAMTAGMAATLSKFALTGPYGGEVQRSLVDSCRAYWWKDALFVSNIDTQHFCLGQCWYTAVDTQIYICLPIILVPLLWKPNLGLLWMAFVTLVFFCVTPILIGAFHAYPDSFFLANLGYEANYNIHTYEVPWSRAYAYLVGCWAGWLIFKTQNVKVKLAVWQALLGWLVAATIASLVIYGIADYNSLGRGDSFFAKVLPVWMAALYGGLGRGAWALALLWVVFACHTGYGGLINEFLSHPSWQPLSRLTYSLYLVALPIQAMYMGYVPLPLYMDHTSTIVQTSGYLFVGGLVALWLSLAIEAPIIGLEKLMIRRPAPKRD
ncbi:nose resistant to fluoxetine protein 6-like [Penaeus japonicus]|uniref:nose resistant to fluoxetine protein 6-like n=1 Tax=Penaeus japonicus TaxID=27405 RepID=UPI001C712C78|nr:nose resistant to fluoxetine protein 6-like [Penaeus japonicus]XP_042891510.1 nose resistant to fluoxetine protein 6-like [Penaeus japonicus]